MDFNANHKNVNMNLYPLKFQPIFKYRIWGGHKLRTVLEKDFDGDQIGESWEISDVQGDETLILDGPLQGQTLKQIINTYKGEIVGEKVFASFGNSFPLLIKFIDANLPLSIQVHPDDEHAKSRHQSFGKNEMWYIMDAETDAEIIVGFKEEIQANKYLKKLEEGSLLELLNIEKVSKEDVYYIPAGRVHAIGAGVLLAEIQQTSDITYRIFDYNRIDTATGKERALHNDLAIDVIDFNSYPSYKTTFNKNENESNKLVHSPFFTSNFLRCLGSMLKDYSSVDSFVIYICVNGVLEIQVDNVNYSLRKGETVLFPASISKVNITATGVADVLEVYMQ